MKATEGKTPEYIYGGKRKWHFLICSDGKSMVRPSPPQLAEQGISLLRLLQPVVQQHRKRSLQLVVPPVELAISPQRLLQLAAQQHRKRSLQPVVLPVELATSLQRLPQLVVQQHRKRSLQPVALPVELAISLQRLLQLAAQQHRKRSLQLVVLPVELATSKSSTPGRQMRQRRIFCIHSKVPGRNPPVGNLFRKNKNKLLLPKRKGREDRIYEAIFFFSMAYYR
jgi:hypothetical protein